MSLISPDKLITQHIIGFPHPNVIANLTDDETIKTDYKTAFDEVDAQPYSERKEASNALWILGKHKEPSEVCPSRIRADSVSQFRVLGRVY